MTSLPPPTMILIIPLMLNTFSAPEKWVLMARAPEIVYHTADEPHDDLSSGSSAGNHSWLPPMDMCSSHFDIVNTTDSSVLLLLVISLPGPGDQPVHHAGSKRGTNRTVPWTSLRLEPGSYGVPRARDQPFLSYPFLSNMSLDVGFFSFINSSLLPPTMEIEESQHRVQAPILYGVVLCRGDYGDGSFVENLFQDGRRKISSSMKSVSAAQPRKLLGAPGEKFHGRRQQKQSGAHHSKARGNLQPRRRPVLNCRKQRILTTAATAVASALFALLCTIAGLWCKRNNKPEVEVPSIRRTELCPSVPKWYSHRELAIATQGLADEMSIGRGGFGLVYRGYLGDQNRHVVATKVLLPQGSSSSLQGAKEFESEVKVMSRLRHRNIVQLLGWCDGSSTDLLLVYEFVPNGSLDKHLYDPHRVLAWSDRYDSALGVGSAILYLHTECEQCVVHGGIKPANIMLDSSLQAKLGDFGLARLLDHGADSQTTQVVAGTIGYIDPELVNSQRPSAASDVYSFGIVLLEIASGRRVTPKVVQANGASVVHLLNWVGYLYRQNAILGAADRRSGGEFDEQQMKRVLVTGLWCASHDQSQRPPIAHAMDVLRREDAELPVSRLVPSLDAVRSLEERAYDGDSSGDPLRGVTC